MDVPELRHVDAVDGLAIAVKRFPSLFSLTNKAVALYDRDGIIVVGNDASRALIGASLLGAHFKEHVVPDEIERITAFFEVAISSGGLQAMSIFRNRFSDRIKVDIRLSPLIFKETIVGVIGIARCRS